MQLEVMFRRSGVQACGIEARCQVFVQHLPNFVLYLIIGGQDQYTSTQSNFDDKNFRHLDMEGSSCSSMYGCKFSNEDMPYLINFLGFVSSSQDGVYSDEYLFFTHPYGEWTMLIVRKSVLRLLIL